MASICLCMIAKDEEMNIERCIQSVEGLAAELVVVDTGSTDDTVNIAQRLGATVYEYPWDGSFANARNFAMGKAHSEWLLLLDADEALDPGSKQIIADFVHTTDLDGAHFRIRNYTGQYSPDNYSLHNALRLLRKSDRYHFQGALHEQIVSDGGENLSSRFTSLEAVVHHYGYLDEVVEKKQKRRRNIPILEKQLEQNPTEPFYLFNMGNEHLSNQDFQAALTYYNRALEHLTNRNIAFVPHLYFRLIHCYESMGAYERALQTVRAGLHDFPRCTDYEFRRAGILHRLRRYSLAIESYEACLKLGTPPSSLEFVPGCGTYRAACQLGQLYRELEDYMRAIHYYDLALTLKPNLYGVLYQLGDVLNRIEPDKNAVAQKLFAYFANPKYTPNALLGADILTEEGLYPQALASLESLVSQDGHEVELVYVKARALFYQQKLEEAVPLLDHVCQTAQSAGAILRGIRPLSALMLFSAAMMRNDEARMPQALEYVRSLCSESEIAVSALMWDLYRNRTPEDPHYAEEGKAELAAMFTILKQILRCHRFDLFERMLQALNYVDTKEVLLYLAQFYADQGLLPLAADHVLRSVKELNVLNLEGASILLRHLLAEPKEAGTRSVSVQGTDS